MDLNPYKPSEIPAEKPARDPESSESFWFGISIVMIMALIMAIAALASD